MAAICLGLNVLNSYRNCTYIYENPQGKQNILGFSDDLFSVNKQILNFWWWTILSKLTFSVEMYMMKFEFILN